MIIRKTGNSLIVIYMYNHCFVFFFWIRVYFSLIDQKLCASSSVHNLNL